MMSAESVPTLYILSTCVYSYILARPMVPPSFTSFWAVVIIIHKLDRHDTKWTVHTSPVSQASQPSETPSHSNAIQFCPSKIEFIPFHSIDLHHPTSSHVVTALLPRHRFFTQTNFLIKLLWCVHRVREIHIAGQGGGDVCW